MTQKQYSQDTLIRIDNYRQLYHLFEYPGEDSGILLLKQMTLSLPDSTDPSNLNSIKKQIIDFFEKNPSHEETEAEYVRLFDYRPVCPPYETAYRKRVKPHQFINELISLYGESGIKCDETMSPDHISVEFEFMHYLCFKEATAGENEQVAWKDRQRLFFKDHLSEWIPGMCEKLTRKAKSPFSLLGELISIIMETETAWLEDTKAASGVHLDMRPA
jgi:TorA maturation chaperone TorD